MAKNEVTTKFIGKDQTSQTVDKVEKKLDGLSNKWKVAAAAMVATSALLAAGMLKAVKAAADEEAGIIRLSIAMKNVGLSYDDSRESLEAWLDANQQSTSFADTEQRSALASLVRMTGDLESAQKMLTLAMDVAVGTGRDLASANTLIMYAMGGNWGMLERYIPAIKKAQTEQEKWRILNELFAGQATEFGASMAGQFATLENNIGDLKEAFGTALFPAVQSVLDPVKDFVTWMKEHPEVTKMAAQITLLTAGLLGLGGGYMLVSNIIKSTFIPAMKASVVFIWTKVIPALTAKLALLMATLAAMGPVGWVALGVAMASLAAIAVSLPEFIENISGVKNTVTPSPGGDRPSGRASGAPPLMDNGGVVPGAPGSLQPVYARGGEVYSGYPPKLGGDTIIIQSQAFMGSREEARKFAELIFSEGRRNNLRTVGRTA